MFQIVFSQELPPTSSLIDHQEKISRSYKVSATRSKYVLRYILGPVKELSGLEVSNIFFSFFLKTRGLKAKKFCLLLYSIALRTIFFHLKNYIY